MGRNSVKLIAGTMAREHVFVISCEIETGGTPDTGSLTFEDVP